MQPRIPSPGTLGLPAKFSEWRKYQAEAVGCIVNSTKRVVVLEAPTGSGKTAIMAALGKVLKQRILFTCHSKVLQDQVQEDFPYAKTIKGRANYPCLKFPKSFPHITAAECTKTPKKRNCERCFYQDSACEQAVAEGKSCPCVSPCPYHMAKRAAVNSELCVANLALFLTEANYVGEFSGWPWLVLDEGDLTEHALLDFIELRITDDIIEELKLPAPEKKTVMASWVDWAKTVSPILSDRIGELQNQNTTDSVKEEEKLRRLLQRLSFFASQIANGHKWVFDPDEEKGRWLFRPVFVSTYVQHYLWRHAQRVLIMSATIVGAERLCYDLGLDPADMEFITVPSTFPVENRPIIYSPAANMTHKNSERSWPQLSAAVDSIIAQHVGEKGLIHCVSYNLTNYLVKNSRHRSRLVWHSNKDRAAKLQEFKASSKPLVLLSPSMGRGINLFEDLCRWIIVSKVPWPSLGNKQVSARLYSDKHHGEEWYAAQAIRSIVQATGRGVRSETDFCVSYILDEQFGRLYSDHKSLFPKWWVEALII